MLGFHLTFLGMGIGNFGLAVIAAFLYLIQQRELRAKRARNWSSALPSLEMLDRLAVRFLIYGLAFLTIGIITGIYLAHTSWEKDWSQDPKVLLSIFTWVWFAVLMMLRFLRGWRGARFFIFIVIGFSLLAMIFASVYLMSS